MGHVNLPTPVALAGAGICALGGYLLGVLVGPETAAQATATVVSFDGGSSRLCLRGRGVDPHVETVHDGVLCGTWRRTDNVRTPQAGDAFRFVTLSPDSGSGHTPVTLIYGDVVAGR